MPVASLLPIMIKANLRLSVISANQKTKRPFIWKPWYHTQLHTLFREEIPEPFPGSCLIPWQQGAAMAEQPASPPPCASLLKASKPLSVPQIISPKSSVPKRSLSCPFCSLRQEDGNVVIVKNDWRILSSRRLKAEVQSIRTGNEAQAL